MTETFIVLGLVLLFFLARHFIFGHGSSMLHAKASGALYDLGVNVIALPSDIKKRTSDISIEAYNRNKKSNPNELAIDQLLSLYQFQNELPAQFFRGVDQPSYACNIIDKWISNQQIDSTFGMEKQLELLRHNSDESSREATDFIIAVEMYVVEKIQEVDFLVELQTTDDDFNNAIQDMYIAGLEIGATIEEVGEVAIHVCNAWKENRETGLMQIDKVTQLWRQG